MNNNRKYNFGAGPAALPFDVLKKAQEELTNYKDSGISVMEMSHRSKEYQEIIDEAEKTLRDIMNIPDNYKVLFLQGGASLQFAAIPLNLMKNKKADYVVSGSFSSKAAKEAKKYGEVRIIGDSSSDNYTYIPKNVKINEDSDYVHICLNNTIYGTQYNDLPVCDIPLVGDASSCILGREIDVKKFGMIYAGAQKNMGIAGLTVVIIREDLIGNAMDICPSVMDYKLLADNGSMYNTPSCYAIYIAGLVFKWIKQQGGVSQIEKINNQKAKLLYDYLDNSKLFKAVAKDDRSIMNVTFVTGDEDLDKKFVDKCKDNNIIGIKGHRSVGGMRASIYNAVELEAVEKLVTVMKEFEEEYYAG